MFDLRFIRTHPDLFDQGLQRRGLDPLSAVILEIDQRHRHALTEMQARQAALNTLAKTYSTVKATNGNLQELTQNIDQTKQDLKDYKHQADQTEQDLHRLLSEIPNLPADDCPDGADEADNLEIRRWGNLPSFDFTPKAHDDLGVALGLMDFERAIKLSGSRFVVLYGDLVRLERALAQFMLDIHTREFGYKEAYVPLMVNESVMFGTGQLPKFRDDQFQTNTGHWLIPTAEVALTNLVSGEILAEADLPLRYTAYTPCFRAEAGAAGRDTRGMIRQHQFSKVELVSITTPEQAVAEHERMTGAAETVLQRLGLAYKVLSLCTGDIGFQSEKTYDLEVWLPSQNTYREISSCSRCNTFQARRMNTRYRPVDGDGKTQFVHTLNGSGVAVGRALVAVMENYQQSDGSIAVPDALQPYMNGLKVIARKS
ncbi:serine--tRNA ligase [Candidatus Finniella inopinata]|uniref:Serine--tRNA ligase n=1 Tax=Candidatus Finniella inopinata TaxID=1696036 RepID=A0A4Q7DJ96_9PROT|nr:serine--tRNA ligase [Candidatus Finniella inopinata]RZI46104.1 serine--tRNA ligase [Candidatus Finniella inopinata]